MKPDSKLAAKLESKDFIVTAEYLPRAGTSPARITEGMSSRDATACAGPEKTCRPSWR